MTTVQKLVPPIAVALGALALVALAQIAGATHVRPKSATPLRVSLVPAYKPCGTQNSTHGTPLSYPSCKPPAQASSFLTVGTADANGAAANSTGFVQFGVTAHGEEILYSGSITDVRCKPATDASVCNGANAAAGADYSGDLEGNMTVRTTDHYNGPSRTDTATVQDIPNPLLFHCVNTSDTSVGAICTIDTSEPLIPLPYWYTGKRVVYEISQVQLRDGGADGNVFSNPQDNTLFAVQGLFVP
jgi:hypothetical protein